MSVFNPKIIDASIRDVTTDLADTQKVDVLIYAMQHLHLERSVIGFPPILSIPHAGRASHIGYMHVCAVSHFLTLY